jgi:large conductance mechanosensitive channel
MAMEVEMLEELKKIREAVQIKPPAPPPKGLMNEFKDFLSKYKVMGLAVAFILGLYLGALIKALVDDLIMPVVELALPSDTSWEEATLSVFRVGHFAGELLTFIIVAFVIFLLIKLTKRLHIE